MAGKIGKAARIAMMADSHKRGGYDSGNEGYRGAGYGSGNDAYRGSGRQNYEYEGDFMPERGYADRSGRMGYGRESMGRGREMYGQERMSRGRGLYDRRDRYDDGMDDERMMGRDGRRRSDRMGSRSRQYEEYDEDEDEYPRGEEPIRAGGTFWMDTPKKTHKLTMETAQEWVDELENEDPAKPEGGKWTMEQVKPFAQKLGIQEGTQKFIDFYVMMNAMYSDYYEVAKKFGATSPDFFAEMAKAFICDKDAVKNKTAMYHDYLVKK